jgi:prophage regulatory protein
MIEIKNNSAQELHGSNAYKRLKFVAHIYGMSAATIWRKCKEGTFPKPHKLSRGVTAWKTSDLDEWEADPLNYKAKP